ncbi:MAG TPA: hypothetical protein VFQ13_00815 [Anaerolineales bacterium]|nr:hypothetical protein [Anaerolineales bacterium]
MLIAKPIIGGIVLFLGRELHFLFAAAMAALIGFRLAPLLPSQWPGWYSYVFIGLLAVLAALVPIIHEHLGYVVSGFLAGGYLLVEYYAPGVSTLPLLTFLIGGITGALVLGIFTEWALMIVSSAIGAYYVGSYFALPWMTQILVTSGLFVIGVLTQVVLWYMEKH